MPNILFKVIYPGYLNRYYSGLLDTGAAATLFSINCLPEWKKLKVPINLKGFNDEGNRIEHYNENIYIQIFDKKLKIPKVYGFDLTNKDIIIGWDFIKLYLPINIHATYVSFTTNCDKRIVKSPIVANQKRKPQE